MRILVATGNRAKFREMRDVLREHGIEAERVDVDYPELQSDSPEEIAAYGARYCAESLGKPVIVEDSGLFVDALNGFPGPYSAYVYETIGNEGILRLLEGEEDRSARFISVIGYCEPGGEPVTFTGEVRGRIAEEPRGEEGFGYDPIFIPEGREKTFAELGVEEKCKMSHRARALEKFARWFKRHAGR
ncbi:MAG: XTP/dITP diphosphatase [Euryarchaeota archaeon]